MAVSPETRVFVMELFTGLGEITARAMMGGLSIYRAGQIFAILGPDQRIYLKASGALAEALASEGSEQFAYEKTTGRVARMGYWTLPEAALDDPDLACDWARRALAGFP